MEGKGIADCGFKTRRVLSPKGAGRFANRDVRVLVGIIIELNLKKFIRIDQWSKITRNCRNLRET